MDEDLKRDVVDQLYWDNRVDASRVTVDVLDGVVTLGGYVPSYGARKAALADAWSIPGVVAVEDRVTVTLLEAAVPGDDEIVDNIGKVLKLAADLEPLDIEVSSDEGTVTLRGTVESYWKKARTAEIAAHVFGVREIRNELRVVPTDDFVDASIAESIAAALGRTAGVDPATISIEVQNGVVRLTGAVASGAMRRVVDEIVQSTAGVTGVRNNLRIGPAK